MDISNIGQYLPSTSVQSGKSEPVQPANKAIQAGEATEEVKVPRRKVDMRNISLNEINELIKGGEHVLLERIPWGGIDIDRFKNDADDSYREYLANKKIDFIGATEGAIKFEKVEDNRLRRLKIS